MNRRDSIEMTAAERAAYLEAAKTVILSTLDRQGYPHSVAMWFALPGGIVHMTTFGKSQKVVNLRRDPRAALLVEDGDRYTELRGLLMRGRCEIVEDVDLCTDILVDIQRRYHPGETPDGLRDLLRAQARKRVAIRFHPERTSSWDHRKLGGVY